MSPRPTEAARIPTVTWDQVVRRRLGRQYLDARRPLDQLVDVVTGICGLHAQVRSSADLSLWARLDGVTRTDVDRAIDPDRTLVKLWAMRGTLHLLPAGDLHEWYAAFGTYDYFLKPAWTRASGLTPADLDTMQAAMLDVLDGPPLTRTALADAVAERAGSPGLRDKILGSWGSALKPASFRGALCFATNTGQHVRFTRPDRWIPGYDRQTDPSGAGFADPEAALGVIMRRVLAAYGPMDRDELARWWGAPPSTIGRVLKAAGDNVVEVDVEGRRGWLNAEDLDGLTTKIAKAGPKPPVRLLPAFDPWIIGATRQAKHLYAGGQANVARVHRNQGWISAVVLVDGRVEGIWRHERKGTRVAVEIEPFVKPKPATKKQIEAEAERLAAFVGGTLDLTWLDL